METLDVSFNEVLAEIEKLSTDRPEGFTIAEMSDATGRSVKWCRTKIRRLMAAGKAQYNGRAIRSRIDGQTGYVPVYLVKSNGRPNQLRL